MTNGNSSIALTLSLTKGEGASLILRQAQHEALSFLVLSLTKDEAH